MKRLPLTAPLLLAESEGSKLIMSVAFGMVCALMVLSTSSAQATSSERTPIGKWVATSNTATAITGDLVVTSKATITGSLGIKIKAKPSAEISGSTAYSTGGDSLASLLGVNETDKMQLWPVSSEVVKRKGPNGGLCAKARTKYLVLAIASSGPQKLYVAAFTAKPGPGAKPKALCGTYNYEM